jgi:hypothetical protein
MTILDHFFDVSELLSYQRAQLGHDLRQFLGVFSGSSSLAKFAGSILSVHYQTGWTATRESHSAIGLSL